MFRIKPSQCRRNRAATTSSANERWLSRSAARRSRRAASLEAPAAGAIASMLDRHKLTFPAPRSRPLSRGLVHAARATSPTCRGLGAMRGDGLAAPAGAARPARPVGRSALCAVHSRRDRSLHPSESDESRKDACACAPQGTGNASNAPPPTGRACTRRRATRPTAGFKFQPASSTGVQWTARRPGCTQSSLQRPAWSSGSSSSC